jgi:hypothetical protein
MKFLSGTVGQEVMKEIEDAVAVDIASAYFSPGDDEIGVLRGVPELRIYVSREFDVSDPRRLEALSDTATVRCIPVDDDEGRFHAKVVFCRRPDGSKVAFVGSANFTGPGLFQNHEACVRLDTMEEDGDAIEDLSDWIDELEGPSAEPDWAHARSVHENSRRKRRMAATGPSEGSSPERSSLAGSSSKKGASNFWVLKTRHGKTWADYWQKFKSEEVVAIGWEELTLNPAESTKDEIERQLDEVYSDEEVGRPARTAGLIRKFVDSWGEGDLVLMCRGFPGNHSGDVFFYGYARVEGDFFLDETDSQRKFKRPANIQEVEISLPMELYVETLDRGSLMETMHDLTEGQFFDFCRRVENEHGVSLKLQLPLQG